MKYNFFFLNTNNNSISYTFLLPLKRETTGTATFTTIGTTKAEHTCFFPPDQWSNTLRGSMPMLTWHLSHPALFGTVLQSPLVWDSTAFWPSIAPYQTKTQRDGGQSAHRKPTTCSPVNTVFSYAVKTIPNCPHPFMGQLSITAQFHTQYFCMLARTIKSILC